MTRGRSPWRAVLPLLLLLSCSSDAPTLFVDLRTDLVPVVELAEVTSCGGASCGGGATYRCDGTCNGSGCCNPDS